MVILLKNATAQLIPFWSSLAIFKCIIVDFEFQELNLLHEIVLSTVVAVKVKYLYV